MDRNPTGGRIKLCTLAHIRNRIFGTHYVRCRTYEIYVPIVVGWTLLPAPATVPPRTVSTEYILKDHTEELREKLDALEIEAANLRLNLSVMTGKHEEAKAVLSELVASSLTAAKLAAFAADNAVLAAKKAVVTAEQVAAVNQFLPSIVAVQAASAAASAAVDSATAASRAVAAAALAAAHEDNKTVNNVLMHNVAKAEAEAKRAFANALEAVRLAFAVAERLVSTGRQSASR